MGKMYRLYYVHDAEKPKNRLDRYWRLRSKDRPSRKELETELREIKIAVSRTTFKSLLLSRADGAKRGRPDYTRISRSGLDSFIVRRGLPLQPTTGDAITCLLRADERLKFPRFLHLPPELRNRVYEYHFASMPQQLRPCSQPPISRTSTLIRSETLALFYRSFTFELVICRPPRTARQANLRLEIETELFLAKVSRDVFGCIRKFQIRVERPAPCPEQQGKCNVSCDLAINTIAGTYAVKVKPAATKKDIVLWRKAGHRAQRKIENVLKRACQRVGERGLRPDDIYEVRDLLEVSFW